MAESKNNIITHGLSGKVGDLIVFRNKGGRTFVSSAPRKPIGEPSDAQKEHQKRFQEAVFYTKGITPEVEEMYKKEAKKKGITYYNVSVADFMKAPEIVNVDLSNYTGAIGDTIVVTVHDNFKVASVTVEITNADGSEVENGAAVSDASSTIWTYTAKAANASLAGDKITIRAYDMPGNVTEEEKEI